MTYDLIIFDCDGTLTDSEELNNQCVIDYLNAEGFGPFDLAYAYEHFMGWTLPDIVIGVAEAAGRPVPVGFRDKVVALNMALMPKLLRPVPDVREVVEACALDYKICVASNGERENVIAFLETVGVKEFFPDAHVFTKEMVPRGKPSPDLFLLAAKSMGVDPVRCAVIEDSLPGATAGLAAGMRVIGFTGVNHDPAAQEVVLRGLGVQTVTDRLIHIPELLKAGKPCPESKAYAK